MGSLLDKLKMVREKEDIQLPDSPNFRSTYFDRHGVEKPLRLRNYQSQMVVHLLAMRRFVIGDDTGLGKTIEMIAALCQLWRKTPNLKVIVLTKKSSIPGWEDEGFGAFTQGVTVRAATGGPKARKKMQLAWHEDTGPQVIIQSYTSACNDIGVLKDFEGFVLVCDEATVFANPSTRTHKVCRYLSSRADRVYGLTATLIKNHLMEGFGVYKVVVPDLFQTSRRGFINQYCIVRQQRVGKGKIVEKVVGYAASDIDKFRDQIDLYYLGRAKHTVATELPVLQTRDVEVGMTKFQAERYAEALTGLLLHGDGEYRDYTETVQMTKLIYCQEIVNHPGLIEYEGYRSEKLDALTSMVTEGGDFHGEKVIVFSRFKKMVDIAIEHLTAKGVRCVRVTGAEKIDQRKTAMREFQDPSSDTMVIFITMAGGDAINLQAAKALVFFDTPWSAGDYLQIIGRMIRIGSEHDRCYAIHLICRGSIDEHVQAVVRKKMKLIEQVLGERIKGEKGGKVFFSADSSLRDVFDLMLSDARAQQ